MSEKFVAPPVHVGQTVQWFVDVGGEPEAAIVTNVCGNGIVTCMSFDKSGFSMTPREAARHVSDPDRRITVNNGGGCWGHVPCEPITQEREPEPEACAAC
jgi:hypothetical protein